MSVQVARDELSSSSAGIAQEGQNGQADHILRALRLCFRSVQKHNQLIEDQCGVGGVQMWALWEIDRAGKLKISEIAQKLSIHQSTASNLLDKLEKQQFIRRERNDPDQRIVRVSLTESGKHLLATSPPVARNLILDALMELPEETLSQLAHGMDALVRNLKVQDASGESQPLYRL